RRDRHVRVGVTERGRSAGASPGGGEEPMDAPPRPVPTHAALFLGFLQVGVSGFGGVLPFARRTLVATRRWWPPEECNEVLALGQFLPGPNIVNVSVIIGRRFHGVMGSLIASVGLMFAPLTILLILATLYAEFAQYDVVRRAAHGVSV